MTRCAPAALAQDTDSMRVVDQEAGLVTPADLEDLRQRRNITPHAEDTVHRDERRFLLRDLSQDLVEVLDVVVAEAEELALG